MSEKDNAGTIRSAKVINDLLWFIVEYTPDDVCIHLSGAFTPLSKANVAEIERCLGEFTGLGKMPEPNQITIVEDDEPISTEVDRSIATERECLVCGQLLPHSMYECLMWLRGINKQEGI